MTGTSHSLPQVKHMLNRWWTLPAGTPQLYEEQCSFTYQLVYLSLAQNQYPCHTASPVVLETRSICNSEWQQIRIPVRRVVEH
eukprot:1038086-Pelagomonas_calceolata.AAC.2